MFEKLKSKSFWIHVSRDIVIFSLIIYIFNWYQQREITQEVQFLPEYYISGQTVNFLNPIENKDNQSSTFIYFWGSWCPICRFTSSTFSDLSHDYPVISIALSSGNNNEVQEYLNEKGYEFQTINDPNGEISRQWGVVVTPTIFVIDQKGKISSVTTGLTSKWGLIVRYWFSQVFS